MVFVYENVVDRLTRCLTLQHCIDRTLLKGYRPLASTIHESDAGTLEFMHIVAYEQHRAEDKRLATTRFHVHIDYVAQMLQPRLTLLSPELFLDVLSLTTLICQIDRQLYIIDGNQSSAVACLHCLPVRWSCILISNANSCIAFST